MTHPAHRMSRIKSLSWPAYGLCMGVLMWGSSAAGAAASVIAERFVLSKDGASVVDTQSKLVWSRCVDGMAWNGKTCTGKPLLLSHGEAGGQAKRRLHAEGLPWRLPRVTELQRLSSRTASPPGLYHKLFPAAPVDWHWAMTASVSTAPASVNQYNYGNIAQGRTSASTSQLAFLHGWAVNPQTGEARDDLTKRTPLPVRLVRAQQD